MKVATMLMVPPSIVVSVVSILSLLEFYYFVFGYATDLTVCGCAAEECLSGRHLVLLPDSVLSCGVGCTSSCIVGVCSSVFLACVEFLDTGP